MQTEKKDSAFDLMRQKINNIQIEFSSDYEFSFMIRIRSQWGFLSDSAFLFSSFFFCFNEKSQCQNANFKKVDIIWCVDDMTNEKNKTKKMTRKNCRAKTLCHIINYVRNLVFSLWAAFSPLPQYTNPTALFIFLVEMFVINHISHVFQLPHLTIYQFLFFSILSSPGFFCLRFSHLIQRTLSSNQLRHTDNKVSAPRWYAK